MYFCYMNKQQRRKRWADIIKLSRKGKTPKEITLLLNADYTSVLRTFKKYNLKLEGSGGSNRAITTNFLQNDTDKNNYFIGYLAADGNIYKTAINLYSIDIRYLESFSTIYNQPFNYYYYGSSIGTPMVQLGFGNKQIVEWLKCKYNLGPNKSKVLKLHKLNWSILRGIFDGDGSAKKEIKITSGSIHFVEQLELFLEIYNIKSKRRIKGINMDCYDVVIPAKYHYLFAFYLYKDAELFMERKYTDMCALLSKDNKEKWDKLLEN